MKSFCIAAFLAVALALLPACRMVALYVSGATRFDFESDAIGSAPTDLFSRGEGWIARIESGQAASGNRSVRLFAQRDLERSRFGDLSLRVDAKAFRGKVVRVSASLRVEESAAQTSTMRLFVHVERPGGRPALDDAMEDSPLRAVDWTPVELVGAIAADATAITFGTRVTGPGPFHLDDLALEALRSIGPEDPKLLDRVSARQLSNPDIHVVHLRSALLSRFFGRDIFIDAGVVVPPESAPGETAACYQIADFEGSWGEAYTQGAVIATAMRQNYPRMMYVWLDGGSANGHHAFADSVNAGPWGEALVNEIMPAIEARFLGGRAPRCRYVTGQGSGGWSALWLQITYPNLFGGAWATAPDPVDFRAFRDTDIYTERTLRGRGNVATSNQGEAQLADYEAQCSPRGNDGLPMPLCDRVSFAIDPAVAQAWRKRDIGALLKERWETLGPKLAGRIHVWCGTRDAERAPAVKLLKADLEKLRAEADVRLVEDRGHADLGHPHAELWPLGMRARIHREMAARTATLVRP